VSDASIDTVCTENPVIKELWVWNNTRRGQIKGL
jgi:hypothetical protein